MKRILITESKARIGPELKSLGRPLADEPAPLRLDAVHAEERIIMKLLLWSHVWLQLIHKHIQSVVLCRVMEQTHVSSVSQQNLFDNQQLGKNKKDMSVEKMYQKKTPLEHILLRPDTYIGSVEPVTQVQAPGDLWCCPRWCLL